jgi:hypothetical protein
MNLKEVLNTISGGQSIQVFADNKEIFYGKMADTNGEELIKHMESKVYRLSYNDKIGALTIAC